MKLTVVITKGKLCLFAMQVYCSIIPLLIRLTFIGSYDSPLPMMQLEPS